MSEKGKRVAVIGAGPMGLAAAYQLCLDGYKPVIFEAGDRIGGMTASFDFGGLEIERYYHFHCTSDTDFFQMLEELGISDKLHWVETKMGYWYQKRLQPWGNPIALLKFKGLSPIAKFRYGLHAFACTKRNDWKDLDKLEASSWIRKWVGNEAYEVMWRKLFDLKFYEYANQLSAAWIWSRVRRIGRSRYSIFREKLGYLDGGSNTLLTAMQRAIEERGGVFRLSTPCQRVVVRDGRVAGVQPGRSAGPERPVEAIGKPEQFDTVISTVPLPYVPDMVPELPAEILDQYRALKNVAVVCVIAKMNRPLTENFWLNVNDDEMDIPGIVEYSNLRPLKQRIVYVPFYMPGDHPKYKEPNEVFIDKVQRYAKEINPGLRDEDFVELRASRYRFAQPVCEPEHLAMLPPASTVIRGLSIADTSFYYPEDRGISESIAFGRKLAREAML